MHVGSIIEAHLLRANDRGQDRIMQANSKSGYQGVGKEEKGKKEANSSGTSNTEPRWKESGQARNIEC